MYLLSSLNKHAYTICQGVVTVLNFWTDSVPTAAWITIFWVVIIFVNIWVVSFFAEIEVVAASIKFTWIFVVIISFIGKSLLAPKAIPNQSHQLQNQILFTCRGPFMF